MYTVSQKMIHWSRDGLKISSGWVNLPNNPKILHYHFESSCFKQDLQLNKYMFWILFFQYLFSPNKFSFFFDQLLCYSVTIRTFEGAYLKLDVLVIRSRCFLYSWNELLGKPWRRLLIDGAFPTLFKCITDKQPQKKQASMAREEQRARRKLCADVFSHNERMQDFQFIRNTKGTQKETSTFSSVYTLTDWLSASIRFCGTMQYKRLIKWSLRHVSWTRKWPE